MFANPKISANVINTFFLDHKAIIIDEIALNGLEGIGFDYLWKCVNKRLSCELTPKIKEKFWNFIVKSKSISFYSLPNPLPLVEIYDRFNIVNEEFGQLMDPTEYLDGPYEYCPIKNEHGSCSTYEKRKPIPTDTLEKPYEDVYKTHGNYLVMVASLEERWKALASHLPISTLSCLTSVHYCILELVGKGRENDERETEVFSKSKKSKGTTKKKYISLQYISEESSNSDEEYSSPELKCQYKVGVSIIRQAYDCFLEAGLKGLTQIEIAQLLGVEFYTCRTICRIFKKRGLVREFLEDKGRQRTARYIAIAATNEIDMKFAAEKKKLLEYLHTNKRKSENIESNIEKKKAKLSKDSTDTAVDDISSRIIPVTLIDGIKNQNCGSLLDSSKKPTLRQLKFATGILKVVKEKKIVAGYQTLSTLVSQETGEPAMDTKSLKLFLQKLITDGQLKIYKLKISVFDKERYCINICPPSIMPDDPLLRTRYKELSIKAKHNYRKTRVNKVINRPMTTYTYPRYLKVQKLHEHIIKLTHFNTVECNLEPGFISLYDIIPEMTVECALGNITFVNAAYNVVNLKISDVVLEQKLKNAPENIRNMVLNSKSLHNSVRDCLKILAVLGLVQLIGDPTSKSAEQGNFANCVFYVNRRAKILDTTGVWPRANENSAVLENSYYFNTFDDVVSFWETVQKISVSTTIITGTQRCKYKIVYPIRRQQDVLDNDVGKRFGDGCGPCGFDSSIFMDLTRYWRSFANRNMSPRFLSIMRAQTKPEKNLKDKKKVRTRKVRSRASRSTAKTKTAVKEKIKRKNRTDPLVKWTKQDDKILTMLKVVVAIMGPVSGCITVRNNVAKLILTSRDPKKIASLCHRRSVHLENNPALLHEKLCVLNELRRRRSLIEKYDGLFKVLRLRHFGNFPKFIQEAKLHVMELLWISLQVAKIIPFIQRTPSVAANLEEFHSKYAINATSAHRCLSSYITTLDSDPTLAVLKEGIILTVMLSFYKEINAETSQQIYKIFKNYTEKYLRAAIEDLRKCGAISAKEKVFNSHLSKIHYNDIVQSSYKMSFVYKRRWQNRLLLKFCDSFAQIIDSEVPQNGIKGSSVINCLFFEMQACDLLDITSVTVPVIVGSAGSLIEEEKLNVIDIEAKFKLKSGTVGWTDLSNVKKFSNLWRDHPITSIFASMSSNFCVDVTVGDEVKIVDETSVIVDFVEGSGETGRTFKELQNSTGLDNDILREKLTELESANIIIRVGYFDNRVVHKKFVKTWLFQTDPDKYIVPAPWLNLSGEIQHKIFLNWLSTVMNKIFECPGSSIQFLCELFEFISMRNLTYLCTFLEKCGFVSIKCIRTSDVDLFSDDDSVQELVDYNPYESYECTLVFPMRDSLTKFTFLKNKLSETVDA
ncbi:uncharacterized protein LOC126979373 isoform X1 [Leptidea sinapis]|uniref:uncharacterized protein LOC126979373 isoform X1 n=1 Tax=Leptidea sinapis TaxID=189913 RepID=UPI0021C27C8C|nr:uncharacterized protein LOC126979373 isoform X1 [Leptidea sinapis]